MSHPRFWASLACGLVLTLAIAGCGEPPVYLNSAAAPGQDPHSVITVTDNGEAQGETPNPAVNGLGAPKPQIVVKPPALPTAKGEIKETASGVKYETIQEGTGAVARSGQQISIRYTGKLEDGRVFDSNQSRDGATFSLGTGNLIAGWEEGVPGMHIGEKRRLTVPPNAGYGALGKGQTIPPNATLIFEVELLDLQ